MNYTNIIDLILDEKDVTVGGGCASAISGAMACGLMGMVANLSKGKDFGYSDEKYDELVSELNILKQELLNGSVEDNKAYMLIVNAYKLPKSNDEEKALRRIEIEKAGIAAATVPLDNAKRNKKVNEIGKSLIGKSNPSCFTDLEAGIELSQVGINVAKANVEVNLPLIKNEEVLDNFKKETEKL